jgi:hypothetical protein
LGIAMSAVIDMDARRQLALLARRLAAGRITNDQFDDAVPNSRDPALHDIYLHGLWPLYDDLFEHRLKGRWALTPEGRDWVARVVLFLRSGNPYRYRRVSGFVQVPVLLMSLLTLGWFGRFWLRRRWQDGDASVWPFYSRDEFQAALGKPTYLHGDAQQCVGAGREN